jgi:CheY-like chemotaxis protein
VLIDSSGRKRVGGLKDGGFDAYLVRPTRRHSLMRIAVHLGLRSASFEIDPGDERPRSDTQTRRKRRLLDVLLVEDNEINALLVRAVLERLGHGVTEVHDGRSAITAANDGRFDAILLDLNLPEIDGYDAARAIRAHEAASGTPPTTIIAITADAAADARTRALDAGCNAVLTKPVDPDLLRQVLGALKPAMAA